MAATKRSALITGSGRNIGRAIALELARRGFNIAINGSSDEQACRSVADEIKSGGGNAIVVMGNIGDKKDVESIVASTLDAYTSVDVLVNNAAIRPSFDFINGTEEEWERIMNTNFKSGFWLSRACLPGMLEKGWGRVIFFTGMNAQQGYPGKSAVSVSKHACWGLSKSLAKDYGSNGVTSNVISPGTIVGEVDNPSIAKNYDTLINANPSGRLGAPTDISSAVGFLASDEAGFINGQLLQINGGVVG